MAKKSSEAFMRCLKEMQEKPPTSVRDAKDYLIDRLGLSSKDRVVIEPNRYPGAEDGLLISGKWHRVLVGTDNFRVVFPGVATSLPGARDLVRKRRFAA